MNRYMISVLLGVIEGVTEFLPVSSTAHLRVSEALLGLDLSDSYWKMFSIVIQLGAILCVPIYFRKRIARFLATFPGGERGDRNFFTHPLTLTGVAFVVTAVPAMALTKVIGENLESLFIIAASLVLGGVVMWVVDAMYDRHAFASPGNETRHVEEMNLGQAAWIGFCQIFSAVFPGVSRSMSTIAAGQIARMTRESALEFSFLLSIPTMVAATGYDLYKSLFPHQGESPLGTGPSNTEEWIGLMLGFLMSFLIAYAVVAWFMRWVRTRGFVPFALYRIVFGAVVLAWALAAR